MVKKMRVKIMKNLEEVVMFFVESAMATVEAKADDGKVTLKDYPKYGKAALAFIPALKDFKKIKQEWDNRTGAKMAIVMANVQERFNIADDMLEKLIEDSCTQAFGTTDIIDRWAIMLKKVKKSK